VILSNFKELNERIEEVEEKKNTSLCDFSNYVFKKKSRTGTIHYVI